ncbi:MAG: hypothetical protein ACSHWU_11475 [Marinicella sp.]
MLNTYNNHITSFLKVSLITTILFGGLLAQSYATTLFSDTIMKMNIEFSATEAESTATQTASMTVHNEQESSIAFGNHQLDIKTTFVGWEDEAKEHEHVLAEIKVQKLDDDGSYELIYSPSLMILRNEWAELKIDSEDGKEGIELKMQFNDFIKLKDDNAYLADPVWLNWGEETEVKVEAC